VKKGRNRKDGGKVGEQGRKKKISDPRVKKERSNPDE